MSDGYRSQLKTLWRSGPQTSTNTRNVLDTISVPLPPPRIPPCCECLCRYWEREFAGVNRSYS